MTIRFFGPKKIPKKSVLLKFAREICSHVKALQRSGETSVIFVSDHKIRNLNRLFLQKNGVTDVIAFNYDFRNLPSKRMTHPSDRSEMPFGDIFISIESAKRQTKKGGHTFLQEIALLILHGFLHLAGYRDDTRRERTKMFAKQTKLFHRINPLLAPSDFR